MFTFYSFLSFSLMNPKERSEKMFYCLNCESEFEKAASFKESHGLSSPPYEEISCCPNCGSESIHEKWHKYCLNCGKTLYESNSFFCSEACRKRGKEIWSKELSDRRKRRNSEINKILKELREYNALHKTNYSYGQFVAIIRPDKKRGRK